MLQQIFCVELSVSDWERALAWYQGVLSLRVLVRDGERKWALLALPGGGAGVALKESDATGQSVGGATLVIETEDLDRTLEYLAAHGVSPERGIERNHEGYRLSRLRDPDGHRVHLFDWRATDRPAGGGNQR